MTFFASVTAMGLTVGMAVAGSGNPGFGTRGVPCTTAQVALALGCEKSDPESRAPRTATSADVDGLPSEPPTAGLVVSEDRPVAAGTGTSVPPNHYSGDGGDSDDEGDDGNDPPDDDDGGDGRGNGDGNGNGSNGQGNGNGNGNGNGTGNGTGNGNGNGDGDGDPGPGLTPSVRDPLFSLPNLAAGRTVERCIAVTYVGESPATVRLYATRSATGLDAYLDVDVVRGQMPASGLGECAGFVPDTADYAGQGAGVLYRGRLDGFPAVPTPGALPTGDSWESGETHAYKISLSLAPDNAAQGLSLFFDFVWEAAA